ncbi:MAG: hypothetical protein AAGB04_32295, partial [Pseudomonadota bacterium]
MRVILHIGTEKTGTTSIQSFLHDQRIQLFEKGIVVATMVDPAFEKNNFALVLASTQDPGNDLLRYRKGSFKEYREKLVSAIRAKCNELSQDQTLVFSSEHLSSRLTTESEILNLRSIFDPDHDFKIVAYVRRQDEMLLGMHAEGIKNGKSNIDISDFIVSDDRKRYGLIYFDHFMMLSMWARVFGRDSIQIAPFESEALSSGDVVEDFATRYLSLKDSCLVGKRPYTDNNRLSGESLFILSKLNELENA